jgi:hypothetical protein
MNYRFSSLVCTILAAAPIAKAQEQGAAIPVEEFDGTELQRELRDRQDKIKQLSAEEKEIMRAAREKAMADPEVKAAFARRDEAMKEFYATLRESMLKADPTVEPVLKKAAYLIQTNGRRQRRGGGLGETGQGSATPHQPQK